MELSNAKGTRDFKPDEKIIRNQVVDKLKKIFERYGYNPIETPILEKYELLSAKFAGGEEILKEIFKLNDQGKRELALRYDLTVPFARFIGMNPSMKMPFKRYQIERVFRDGPIKLGRYREFWQCDIDVVGIKSMAADAEILSLMEDVFKELEMDVYIEVNNRKILDLIMEKAEVPPEKRVDAILSIDKLKKIGMKGVEKELAEKGFSEDRINKIIKSFLIDEKDNSKKLDKLKGMLGANEAVREMEELLGYVNDMGLKNVVFEISLARGLAYYTGPVFEAFLKDSEIKSAVSGGGRYDNMIGNYLGSKQPYPSVGVSFGLEVISDYMKLSKKTTRKSVVDAYVVPIKTRCFDIVKELRDNGIKADMDLQDKGISKNLDYADKYSIPFVIIVGEDEKKIGKVQLKFMLEGKQELIDLKDAIKLIRGK